MTAAFFRALALALTLLALAPSASRAGTMVVTYNAGTGKDDPRTEYSRRLLELALEKTKARYGDYRLVPARGVTSGERFLVDMRTKAYDIPMFDMNASLKRCREFLCVEFPVLLGLLGYRVALGSQQACERLRGVDSLEDLKAFTFGQGHGWTDAAILRANGLRVDEYATYHGLFRMAASGRFDLFPRGVNEIQAELEAFGDTPGLAMDQSIALRYPLPRFFMTTRDNTLAARRVKEGLLRAHADGSLFALWTQFHQASLAQARLWERKIIVLENPFIEGLDASYERWCVKPEKLMPDPGGRH